MARSRSIPTRLLWDPDFADLDSDTQIIMIGLTLEADDEGRGSAYLPLLARELNKGEAVIEKALETLEAIGFLECYQVGKHRYYQHARWYEWEKLGNYTPSLFPAPPRGTTTGQGVSHPDEKGSQDFPGCSENPQGSSGTSWEIPSEVEEKGSRREEKRREGEEEGEPYAPTLAILPPRGTNSVAFLVSDEVIAMTSQVATILKVSIGPSLTRLVHDFIDTPSLSLLGEADAAREYIDTPTRNKRKQPMTVAFFRRWLKRERGDYAAPEQAPSVPPVPKGERPPTLSVPIRYPDLSTLEQQYQAHTSNDTSNDKQGETGQDITSGERVSRSRSALTGLGYPIVGCPLRC